jgi:Protein of unknown function (DUF2865)
LALHSAQDHIRQEEAESCNGGYFPIDWPAKDESDPNQICQALCPGTTAAAYSMPRDDNGLQDAASVQSKVAYSALPSAFKFQKETVPSCTCGVTDVSWSQSLAKAEELLPRHKGDIAVTSALADRLSRPEANESAILAEQGEPSRAVARVKRHPIHFAYRHSNRRNITQGFVSQEPSAFSGCSVGSSVGSFGSATPGSF